MSDLALAFDAERMICDLVFTNGDLLLDESSLPALLVSLGSDSRAKPDDPLPDALLGAAPDDTLPPDRRGWVGDALAEDNQRIGCRLWLLSREKTTDQVRRRAITYAREGLAWAKGRSVSVEAGWIGNRLMLRASLGAARVEMRIGHAV